MAPGWAAGLWEESMGWRMSLELKLELRTCRGTGCWG